MLFEHELDHVLKHRDFDRRTFAGFRGAVQGHRDHLHGDQADHLVSNHHRHEARLAHCAVMQRGHAAGTLDDGVVGRLLAITAILAESEHAAVDDFRIDLAHFFVRQLQPRHRRRPHVPHQHVGFFDQFHQRGVSAGVFQVEHDRAFVAVQVQELGAHARRHRLAVHVAYQVAGLGFDLDHFRTVVGEDLRRQRADHDRSQIDNAYAFERAAGHYRISFMQTPLRRSAPAHRYHPAPTASRSCCLPKAPRTA